MHIALDVTASESKSEYLTMQTKRDELGGKVLGEASALERERGRAGSSAGREEAYRDGNKTESCAQYAIFYCEL